MMSEEHNKFVTPKIPEAGETNNASQTIILNLRHQLEHCNYAINGLKGQIKHHELQERSHQKEKNDIINERNELLKILYNKNNMIERMSSDIKILETQLKSTVSEKFDALIRLNAIEGNEQPLFKETISEVEGQLLSRELNSSSQKLQYEQDQSQNEYTDINLTLVNVLQQGIDEPVKIHSGVNHRTQNDGRTTNQSKIPNAMIALKLPDAKSSENYENRNLIESPDCDLTVKRKKNKRASKSLEINVDKASSQYDCQNIQLDLLSEVRTRSQNQFLRDAFRR